MKKCRVLSPFIFYIAFFICNFINSFALLRGWFNPNISPNNSFITILLGAIGDLGVLSLIFILIMSFVKKDKNRIRLLSFASLILFIFIIFLQGFSNMFSTLFSYTQLVSFKNPSQGKLISGYVFYFLGMFKYWNIIFPTLMFIILLVLRLFIKYSDEIEKYKVAPRLIGLGVSVIAMLFPTIMCVTSLDNTANELSMNGLYGSSQMGTYNYYIYSIKDLWKKDVEMTIEKEAQITTFLNKYQYSNNNNALSASAENKNLIILQLEAINDFVINLKLDGEEITPNLNNLVTQGYYNNRFYSAAGMGNTSDCEFSSIIGLYPNGNDLSIFELDGEHYPTIAKEFNEKGYNTFSIHGNEGGFYNRNYQHISLFGFNEHIDRTKLLERNNSLNLIHDWISDDSLLQECISIYQEQTNPFFSYNILVSSHSPFGASNRVTPYENDKLTSLAQDYLSYVKYVDMAIGNFIQGLKDANLYDDSVIIIYGDHTSSLLKRDTESITGKDYNDIEFRLEMQNVPFIMLGNNIVPTLDTSVHSNIDIFPTVANLFNLTPQYKFGADMLSNDTSYVYNPRSLDIIYDDYVILSPSKSIYYTNKNGDKLNQKEINTLVKDFEEYKYLNDLLVSSSYFK